MSERIKLVGALATLYVVWGSTYLAIRVLVRTVPGLWAGGLRFVGAAVLLGGWAVLRARHDGAKRPTAGQVVRATTVGLLVVAASLGLLMVGEQHVGSGLASLLIASVPLLVVVLRALHRERPTRTGLAGVAAGFAGLALVVSGGAGGGSVTWMVGLVVAAGCEATVPSMPGGGSFPTTRS